LSTKSRPGEGCAYSKGSPHFNFTIRLGALVVFKGTSNTGTPKELLPGILKWSHPTGIISN